MCSTPFPVGIKQDETCNYDNVLPSEIHVTTTTISSNTSGQHVADLYVVFGAQASCTDTINLSLV